VDKKKKEQKTIQFISVNHFIHVTLEARKRDEVRRRHAPKKNRKQHRVRATKGKCKFDVKIGQSENNYHCETTERDFSRMIQWFKNKTSLFPAFEIPCTAIWDNDDLLWLSGPLPVKSRHYSPWNQNASCVWIVCR
jgi:hypothetical protein